MSLLFVCKAAFGEAPAVIDGPLTLERAIAIARSANPAVASAGHAEAAARARVDQARADRYPWVGLLASGAHHLDLQRLLPIAQPGDPSILSRDIAAVDAVVTVPLYAGGRIVHTVEAAELSAVSAAGQSSRTRDEISSDVAIVYLAILARTHLIDALQLSLQAVEGSAQRVAALVEGGKAANVDRLRTEVQLADVRLQLMREKNSLAIERRTLLALMGVERAAADEIVLAGVLTGALDMYLPSVDEGVESAMSRRQDLAAARSALAAQELQIEIARAGRRPAVSLSGSYGARAALGETVGTGNEADDIGRIGVVLSVPLLEGGRTAARVREESAELERLREQARGLEIRIRLEVDSARLDVLSAREQVAAVSEAVGQAEESLGIEQQKYELGRGTIVDVLDAQSALVHSQSTYYRALANAETSLVRLRLAMGVEP